jgi:3-phenylpropionate/trans-cinnamate dioxygenase ferredoxin reductase subunit
MQLRYDYVLIGGFAAVNAAQAIRQSDPNGTIALFGDEAHPPYDRPPLSKNYLQSDDYKPDDAYSKYDDFYPKSSIELHTATAVVGVDRQAQTVTLANGSTVGYGKLLIATGSKARPLGLPGEHRPGVHLLRHIEDAEAIRKAFQSAQKVVVLGAGYLGMEVGADALMRGLDVIIIEPKEQPWAKNTSPQFGRFLAAYYEAQGAKFVFGDEIVRMEGEGENGPVNGITTKQGVNIPCDVVVGGVGAVLNTELAGSAGLEVDEQNGVKVNEYLQTSDPNIYVAGDIAFFKDIALQKEWHAEHHLNAKWQGQTAGANMAGANQPYDKVAYFFSDELDIHIILRGAPQAGNNSFFVGDVDGAEFVELYHDEEGRLTMGIAVSHEEPKLDPLADTLERLIRARFNVRARQAEVQTPGFDLNAL